MSQKEIPHGHKFDAGKPKLELIPMCAYRLAAEIMTAGANKYNENNWTGLNAGRIIGAAFRHLNYYLCGQDVDTDSGQHHLGHFLANLIMLHHILNNFPEQDDRRYIKSVSDPVESKDRHIYRESRKNPSVPQYTLLPADSLMAAALALDNLDSIVLSTMSIKTLLEHTIDSFIPVVDGSTINVGYAIAYTMVCIEQISELTHNDDRIFTYLYQ
jgi:hypothetical protein